MILHRLIQTLPGVESTGATSRARSRRVVTGVTSDGHRAGPGVVFVALPDRLREDPHLMETAVARRPAAVIAPVGVTVPARAASVAVRDSVRALAFAAASLHGFPARQLRIIGIAGDPSLRFPSATLLHQVLDRLAPPAGLLAGRHSLLGGRTLPGAAWSLDPFDLHQALAAHLRCGAGPVVLEVPADPVPGFDPDVLPRTPVSGDPGPGGGIRILQSGRRGTVLGLELQGIHGRVAVPLVAGRQVEALGIAIRAALGLGFDGERIRAVLPRLAAPAGCLEPVAAGQPFEIRVDSAADPAGLVAALRELRAVVPGRLILVLGARPDWDPGTMAAWRRAAALADVLVATSDDPGHLDAGGLAGQLGTGIPGRIEGDRAAAIRRAVASARPGDGVLIAGKGPDGRMRIGDVVVPWDDRRVARLALAAAGYPGEDWD